jgi:hypothetical protein
MCDFGWKEVYDKLMASNRTNVQDSLKVWYPLESGIREKIEVIHQRHPRGFQRCLVRTYSHRFEEMDGTAAMDLAEQELKYYLTLQRAKKKLRGYLLWSRILTNMRKERAAKEEEEAKQKAENANPEEPNENAEEETQQKAEYVSQAQPDEYDEEKAQEKAENVSQAQPDEKAREEARKSEKDTQQGEKNRSKYYLTLQRTRRKLRGYLVWSKMFTDKRKKRAARFKEEEATQKVENAKEETQQGAKNVRHAEAKAQGKSENGSQAQPDENAEEEARKSEKKSNTAE